MTNGPQGLASISVTRDQSYPVPVEPVYKVSFRFPLKENPGVVVQLKEAGQLKSNQDPPVKLVLPSTGSLMVQVKDERGGIPGKRITVVLDDGEVIPLVEGKAIFPFIAVGLKEELCVSIHSPDQWAVPWQYARCKGPVSQGEQVIVEMTLNPHPVTLKGKLLDESGNPLSDALFAWALKNPGQTNSGTLATDSKGVFTLGAKYKKPQEPMYLTLVHWEQTDVQGRQKGPMVSVALPFPLPRGQVDLGELRCLPSRLLVRGVIQDNDGKPVVGAYIMTWSLLPGRDAEKANSWIALDANARTDAQGGFEIHGAATGFIRIRISHRLVTYGQMHTVQIGSDLKTFVINPSGSIAGWIKVDPEYTGTRIYAWATRKTDERAYTALCNQDGKFLIKNVPPDTYCVELKIADTRINAVRVDRVVVQLGQATLDPRLQGVDLSGKLARLRLQVFFPAEIDKRLHQVWVGGLDDKGQLQGVTNNYHGVDRDGRVALPMLSGNRTYLLGAPGCLAQKIEPVGKELVVRLHPGPRICLQVKADPPGTFYLTTHAIQSGRDRNDFLARRSSLGCHRVNSAVKAGDSRTLYVPGPGRYRIAWEAVIKDEDNQRYIGLIRKKPTVITVRESRELQTFTIGLSAEEMQAARNQ